jgi:sugar/nucleoside kinase (ribokinase family)
MGIDYLLIGHVTSDLTPDGSRLGGTATFGALTARALGQWVGVLTSAPDSMRPSLNPLEGVEITRIPSEQATTFENVYTPDGRRQIVHGRATPLNYEQIPAAWRAAPIVHLGPLVGEVDPALANRFPDSLLGITPQGWMRSWDKAGRVSFTPWEDIERIAPHAGAVIYSIEDINNDEALARAYARHAAIQVVTRGSIGCTLYIEGREINIPAPRVPERDATGSGDIFATAFFIRLKITGDPLAAAQFATRIASESVTRVGLDGVPRESTIRRAQAYFPEADSQTSYQRNRRSETHRPERRNDAG